MSNFPFQAVLVEPGEGRKANTSYKNRKITLEYPCSSQFECTPYIVTLPKGIYEFKLYGTNGGIPTNLEGMSSEDSVQAGGIVSGIIKFDKRAIFYATLGGKGNYLKTDANNKVNSNKGGYNGGGSSYLSSHGTSSGGGSSDIRIEFNDVFHRILVAGSGGGQDDSGANFAANDGRGGAGGGEQAQGIYSLNTENTNYAANQEKGFTFGSGEGANDAKSNNSEGCQDGYNTQWSLDICGSGSGWFGGFSPHHINRGCGGGSSFALTKDTTFKSETFKACDEFYQNCVTKKYAFVDERKYTFSNVVHQRGVWYGNGKLEIRVIRNDEAKSCSCKHNKINTMLFYLFVSS